MHKNLMKAAVIGLAALATLPLLAFAATATAVKTSAKMTTPVALAKPIAKAKFYYGAWLPFWTTQAGEQDIAIHLDSLNEVSPFSYELGSSGAIIDDLKINSGIWDGWFSAVHDNGLKIIPTIAWFDTGSIYNLLSGAKTRQSEEDSITSLVKTKNFDGIDIDFEAMSAATKPYYSLFIKGLATRLHPIGKKLTCTVVPRSPAGAIYDAIPSNLAYAEDYAVLNKYCDEVRLMAYDQGTVDLRLNATKGNGNLYAPTADPDWVTKVVQLALQSISARKIMLGIPTYGYEYEADWSNGVTTYQRVRAFDYFDAMDRADSVGIAPVRNNAGELSLIFSSSTYIHAPPGLTSVVESAQPPQLMNINPNATTTFFVSFPDAQSEMDKIALAKKFHLRGVIFFKADGQMDPAIWDQMTQ